MIEKKPKVLLPYTEGQTGVPESLNRHSFRQKLSTFAVSFKETVNIAITASRICFILIDLASQYLSLMTNTRKSYFLRRLTFITARGAEQAEQLNQGPECLQEAHEIPPGCELIMVCCNLHENVFWASISLKTRIS